jgi:DNA helicase-2/ATP-dependent DNA helicase PcrA
MDDILSTLNEGQRRAVETTEGPVLVLSGAGTGKTRVLVDRIGHILDEKKARDWEILALTFTNRAAKEMNQRLEARTMPKKCDWAGTFHSICLRILRRNFAAAGLKKDFLIYGESAQKSVLKTVIKALGLDTQRYKPGDMVERIGLYKDTFGESEKGKTDDFDKIYRAYNAELDRMNGLDFGDIIVKTIQLFQSAPDVLQKYQRQFKYILIDEYQDTNVAQHEFLKVLTGGIESPNLCCVGDEDQSIYSWRGARIEKILHFAKDYPGAKIIRLEQNYRSTEYVLKAANSLIGHNVGRLGKNLFGNLGDGNKVQVVKTPAYSESAELIANVIKESKKDYSDFAILIRNGSLARPLEEALARRQIPYRLIGAMKFYDRTEIQDVIAYARLLLFPFDEISFARIIGKPKRGIGEATVEAMRDLSRKENIPIMEALRRFPLKSKKAMDAAEFLDIFNFDWQAMHPVDAVQLLLDRAGYIKMWEESKDVDKDDRLKNIRELLEKVIKEFDTLIDFLEQASLMTADDEKSYDKSGVSIMTIHTAKGVEFDTVFLPAWMDGIFPNEISVSEGGLEEERRLAYVAITRAKRNCVILYSDVHMQFGQPYYQRSQFIDEIDPEFIVDSQQSTVNSPQSAVHSRKSKIGGGLVGKMIDAPDHGKGVVLEERPGCLIVAFKSGIKKIQRPGAEG